MLRFTHLVRRCAGRRLFLGRSACSDSKNESGTEKLHYVFPLTPYRSEEEWKAMRSGDPYPGDPNENLKNFDLVVKRACDVVEAMVEKKNTKLLHLYCGYGFVEHFGKVFYNTKHDKFTQSTNFAITGCSDNQESYDAVKGMKQYAGGLHLVDMASMLPFRYQTYQFVVSLVPPHYSTSISVEEIVRNVTHDGFALIGVSEKIWEQENILQRITALEEKGDIEFQSAQTTELDDCRMIYHMVLLKGIN